MVFPSESIKKDQLMDKNTLDNSFGKWISPINFSLFEEQVTSLKIDYYTADSAAITDQMVLIGTPQKRAENLFRVIEVKDSKGNLLRLVTNRFDLSSDEISEMYKSRWAIELFFKWLKQHVNIKKFYGQSEWAIHNQVFLALIVYCLNVLIQLETKSRTTILQISRWLRAAIWKPHYVWIRKVAESSVP